jgi:hypothetical protein
VIVAKHRIARADKSEIVQRLDHGRAFTTGGAINRGRHHGKSVVKVRHLNPVLAHKNSNRFRRFGIPYRVSGNLKSSGTLDGIVVKLISDNFVSTGCEQVRFRGKHLVFGSRLLVTVMGNEYSHRRDQMLP